MSWCQRKDGASTPREADHRWNSQETGSNRGAPIVIRDAAEVVGDLEGVFDAEVESVGPGGVLLCPVLFLFRKLGPLPNGNDRVLESKALAEEPKESLHQLAEGGVVPRVPAEAQALNVAHVLAEVAVVPVDLKVELGFG